MSEEEFQKAFADQEFIEMLLSLETGEEVQKALAEKNIVLTPEELDKFAEILVKALENPNEISNENEKPVEIEDEETVRITGGKRNEQNVKQGAIILAVIIGGENYHCPAKSWLLSPRKKRSDDIENIEPILGAEVNL